MAVSIGDRAACAASVLDPAPTRVRVLARGARVVAVLAIGLLCVAGCSIGRRSTLPSPRESDARALRAEATAHPEDAEPLYQLALVHARSAAPDSALAALGVALQRQPEHAPSLTLLARLLHDAGRSAEALHYFEARGVATLPEPVQIDVALLYADVGNTLKARKLLKGFANGPYAAAVAANLAYLDLLDEENAAALATLEEQAPRFPDAPQVQLNLALARLRAGQVDAGAKLLEELAARYPDDAAMQSNVALLRRHYRFDEAGAQRAEARAETLTPPSPSEMALERVLQGGVEDAAPPAPGSDGSPGGRP